MGNVLTADQSSEALWREVRSPGEVLDLGVPLRQALGLQRLVGKQGKPALSRREGILLGLFALTLHGAVLYWLAQRPEPVLPEVPVQIPPMTIEFASPPPPPPEPVVQEVVKAPEPVVDELAIKKPEPPKPYPHLNRSRLNLSPCHRSRRHRKRSSRHLHRYPRQWPPLLHRHQR
jgi:protein TonB